MATGTEPVPGERKTRKKQSADADSNGVTTRRSAKTGEVFTFFYGHDTPFSQFHSAVFTVDDQEYNCAEQYMMHQKAVVFGDDKMAKEILASKIPREQKACGRKVSNFDKVVWNDKCKDVVRKGNIAKFSQNPHLREALLKTQGTTLVEASPRDRIWGIGMGAKNEKATCRDQWRGKNWLGQVLDEVREEISKSGATS